MRNSRGGKKSGEKLLKGATSEKDNYFALNLVKSSFTTEKGREDWGKRGNTKTWRLERKHTKGIKKAQENFWERPHHSFRGGTLTRRKDHLLKRESGRV